jgi:hypothetical protein
MKRLHLALGRHKWATSVVLVPNCALAWADLQRGNQRFDQMGIGATLRRDPPRTVVFTGDREVHEAIQQGAVALREYLHVRVQEFQAQQHEYENQSTQIA